MTLLTPLNKRDENGIKRTSVLWNNVLRRVRELKRFGDIDVSLFDFKDIQGGLWNVVDECKKRVMMVE